MGWMTNTPKWARSRTGALIYIALNITGFAVTFPVVATAMWLQKTINNKTGARNEDTKNKHKKIK